MRIVIGSTIVLCMFGVTSITTFIHMILNGDDVRNIMDDYFPKDFKDNILKNVYFQSDKLSLLENLEKNKNDQMLEAYLQNDKGEKKNREQVYSTNHGLQLAQSEQLRAEFYEDIWDYFSNKDDNFPRVLIYNDYLQFLRLAQIYDEVEDKQSIIPKKKLISYYDQFADTAWKYGIMVLSYQAYCDLIKKIAKDLYPQEKKIQQIDDSSNSEVYDKYLNQQMQLDPNNKENSNDMLFQNKVHPQDQQQDSIKKSKNKKKKLSCSKRCLYGCCRCMRKIYCSYPQTAYKKLEQKVKNLYVKIFGQKQIIRGKKVQSKKGKQKATSWEFICREMIEKIIEGEEEYEIIKKQGFNIDLKFNLGNLIAILSKFNDMFTFAIIAFSNGIVWIPGWKAFTKADTQKYSVSDGTFINSFQVVYFICFAMAITYAFLSKIAYPFAAKDILGQDKDGNKASFPHPQFFLTKSLQFIGASQFMSIMTTFLDSFICVWEGDSPWYLYRDQNIVCLSNSHVLYMIGAVIGILCYYPVSTFMFPNFQFQDKALDIKYDPTFLVIYMQVKILILGVTSFFKSFGVDDSKNLYIYLQLGTTAFCMLLLSIIQVKNRPCIIGFINIFEIALYLIIATLHITGILILVTDNSYLSLFVAVPVILLIILVTYIIYKKFYKKQVKVKQNINLQDMPDIELTKKQQGGQGLDAVTSKNIATNLALFDENGKQLDPESQNDKSKKHLDMLQRSDKKKKQTQLQLSQSKKSQMNKSNKNKFSGMFQ
ncbi:hypothetical protein PPERSA_06356 [Pseudocohnilembus persalinus]|uniref:Transmembrane protein n=1 Tax=Pseudocohnilembus persalinus TaxID=266149 RepID=A0A0V0QIM8_PSEPJ|nr:hypothetical protein PPERSA_06356 [Pseudocohnilembus persalinus]|eukprot:KRX02161.1 hypothetical protein PPERSA_06356 [Pseudocohnilembus persalinus]